SGEAAQIAENRDNLTPLSVQNPLIGLLHQFRHLWRKESLQAVDALRFFLGDRQFFRHLIEAICQLLQFVPARDRDAMVELSGAYPLNSLLELANRTRHPVRKPVGERDSEKCADKDENQRTPQRGAD